MVHMDHGGYKENVVHMTSTAKPFTLEPKERKSISGMVYEKI